MESRPRTILAGTELDAYYGELQSHHAGPLWEVLAALLPNEPPPKAVPHLWKWADLRPLVLRAGELVPIELAERRVVMLLNPGLEGKIAVTNTLFAGLQLIKPGEIARTHRHTASAIRFIIEGHGAYTAVEGEKSLMEPGDFLTTPNWTWHDHGNESPEPMIWLDGLDLPLTNNLDAIFFELYPERRQPLTVPVDVSQRKYGAGALKPTWERHTGLHSPLLNYRWERSYEALRRLAQEAEGSPYDGVSLEYINPNTGGPVLPTMACFVQMLQPGQHTRAHRHTGGTVYHVVKGKGHSVINGQRFDWAEKDVFVVPSWAFHEHANASEGEDTVLFSFNDSPVLQPLGLYREQPYAEHGGHQEVTSVFGG